MNTYFLCDPLSLWPAPEGTGPSALRILVEVPNYSDAMEPLLKVTILEAVQFKFGDDGYQPCLKAGPVPTEKRSDVKEQFPKEDWTAING
jgi:hypothetical protein